MKKILFLLFYFSNILAASAQWVHQNSGTTDELVDVFFPTKDTGYVSGITPSILKTTNGGANWNAIPNSPLPGYLYFTSRDTGYVTSNDTIFKTVNGGTSWVPQYSNPALAIGAIYFSDKLTGYTSGLNNNQDTMYFIKTINGGNTWNIVSSITSSFNFITPFRSVYFVSRDTGFFAGFDFQIYRTVNGCTSVGTVFNSAAIILSIHFPVKDTGYAVGYPDALIKSVNGGSTWSIMATPSNNDFYQDVFFTTKDTGFIVANGGSFSYGKILKTTDGGNNWITQITDTSINALYFPTRTIGYAVGANGTILKYTGVIGIEENEFESKYLLYPNPSSGIFTFQTISPSRNLTITIFNSFGEVISKSEIHNPKFEIDLSSYPNGIYFLKVTDGEKVAVKKIVKI